MEKLKIKGLLFLKNIGITTAALGAALVVSYFFKILIHEKTEFSLIFLLATVVVARFTDGYVYGIISSISSVLIINFIFTEPYYKFNMILPGYQVAISCLLIVSIIVSAMTSQIKKQETIKIEAEKEKIHANLMRAISHDLRTPLTSIMGESSALIDNEDKLSREEKIDMYTDIYDDSRWLIRMVENILSVTRFRNDKNVETSTIEKSLEVVEEIVSHTTVKIKKYYPDAKIDVSVPENVIFVPMDCVLIEQVLINLVENVIRHGKTNEVKIKIDEEENRVKFSVIDHGIGFKKDILEKVRSGKFVRPSVPEGDLNKTMGIGLSVCDSIVRAHGGKMSFCSSENETQVSFYLPLKEEINE